MIKAFLCDFSRVLLFPKDREYKGSLNGLYDDLLQTLGAYDFFSYFDLNRELLEIFREMKNKFPMYILTTDKIQDVPDVRKIIDPVFDNVFSAKNFALSKTDKKLYLEVAELLGYQPKEMIYIDDTAANLSAAKSAGMTVFHYHNNKVLMKELAPIIND